MKKRICWLAFVFLVCFCPCINAYTIGDVINIYKQYGELQTKQILQTIGNCTSDEANSLIKTVQLGNSPNEKNIISETNMPQQKTFKNLSIGHVTAVIDGDTIKIDNNDTVHLLGVNIPESSEPYAKIATIFLKNLLLGETVYIERASLGNEKVGYDYSFVYIYRYPDGLFVNAEIVRQGYGKCYIKYPFKYMMTFQSLEETAKKIQKGLWKIEDDSSKPTKPVANRQALKNAAESSSDTNSTPQNTTKLETSDSGNNSSPGTVYVHGYYRKDGTYVNGYYRRKPSR
jgi:endonuclease YncB( thermonuclease family)